MKDKELRKLIGSRAKQRRLELNLTQPYVAEKMGVTASTILRYENGSIDNTKKMVLEGLSEALHVSIKWLKGETDEYETDITDKKELQIRDAMGNILKQLPLDLNKTEDAFSKDLLLLMLKQYELFLDSFQFACKNYKGSTKDADIAKVMGFESKDEYNEIMFLREITHTVNAFNDMADVIRLYYKKPEATAAAIDKDGWFHTGDAGYLKGNHLYLTERIKDLFKTSNGKYISPQALETNLSIDRYIDQIAVIADQRKFVSALIVPVYGLVKNYAKEKGLEYKDMADLLQHPKVQALFRARIDTLQQQFAHYEQVKRFTLLSEPFSMERGELTNTLKLKRSVVAKNYKELIDKMYEE